MMTLQEEAQQAIEKYGSIRAAAKALGIHRNTLYDRARKGTKMAKAPATAAPKGRALAEFREQYDKDFIVPRRIRNALTALGKTGWEYELEFVKRAGVSLNDLGRYRSQFSGNVVTLNRDSKRAWAGSVALANQMREMLS